MSSASTKPIYVAITASLEQGVLPPPYWQTHYEILNLDHPSAETLRDSVEALKGEVPDSQSMSDKELARIRMMNSKSSMALMSGLGYIEQRVTELTKSGGSLQGVLVKFIKGGERPSITDEEKFTAFSDEWEVARKEFLKKPTQTHTHFGEGFMITMEPWETLESNLE